MITDTQRRNQILRGISRIPKDKLRDLDEYVSKLEDSVGNKSRTLSFASVWKDMEDDVLDDFTVNLISNRKINRKRIDE